MSGAVARQRGFALTGPIFMIVVVAALGVYFATQSGVAHLTGGYAVRGAQAHFAARSAVEWAIGDIVNNAAGNLGCGGPGVGLALGGAAFAGYTVVVTCTTQGVTEGASSYDAYSLSATATRGTPGRLGYVSRTLIATVTR